MLRNHFLVFWRNMRRNKINSVINIVGLAIGITCVVLITLYVRDELKYDKFLKNANRIYQVNLDAVFSGQQAYISNTPPTIGPALQKSFPEIEAYTRFYVMRNQVVSNENGSNVVNHFTEKKILAVDSNFFQVFAYPMKFGDPATCLFQPHSIVITESVARKYFGSQDPTGKNLVLDEFHEPFKVTGVVNDIPSQSSLQFDLLIPTSASPSVKRFSWSWVWWQVNTYVLLRENVPNSPADIRKLESKFPAMVRVQAANAFKRIGKPIEEFYKGGGKMDFKLQPITEVHLYSAAISNPFLTNVSDIKYVYIFSAIAFLIISLACVNFINLSTAQAGKRAKEVGVRKVLGSAKKQLVTQFLVEALMYTVIAVIVAIIGVLLLFPTFNEIAGKNLHFSDIFSGATWMIILGLTILTGLLAGFYPAFYLTSFNPVSVLKGLFIKTNLSNLIVRNGLVVFQFSISIGLIICTIILYQQLKFSQNKDLGLQKENVIIVPNGEKIPETTEESLRQEITNIPGVTHASITTSIPTQSVFADSYLPELNGSHAFSQTDIQLSSFMVDEEFIPALNLQLISGRNFSKEFNDSASAIVNETAVNQIGWTDPVGKFIKYPGNDDQVFRIIGVVKDFNIESIRNAITPFVLFHHKSKTYGYGTSYIVAKVQPGKTGDVLKGLASKWKDFAAGTPFEYTFLDKQFEALYISEKRMGTLFGVFTALSIVVACLGLFGLSVYTAERRKKEIGVRKVLGATVGNVVGLLSREFIKLVCIGAIIAFPIAWWAMRSWLQEFAYRISIQWWVFAVSVTIALMIAIITVSIQAIKAALANPTTSLRSE